MYQFDRIISNTSPLMSNLSVHKLEAMTGLRANNRTQMYEKNDGLKL